VSFAIPLVYATGLVAGRIVREEPMWKPVDTEDTRTDEPEEEDEESRAQSTRRLFLTFGVLMLLMGTAGYVIAKSASELADRTGIADSIVGALATAVVTSMPELVTTIAAVRRGALQLAVGGIIGGNTFDMLFLTASDISYREGSLYHAVGDADLLDRHGPSDDRRPDRRPDPAAESGSRANWRREHPPPRNLRGSDRHAVSRGRLSCRRDCKGNGGDERRWIRVTAACIPSGLVTLRRYEAALPVSTGILMTGPAERFPRTTGAHLRHIGWNLRPAMAFLSTVGEGEAMPQMNYYEMIGFQSDHPKPHHGPPETPSLDDVILFLNFDGTLVDIVDFPDPVSVPSATRKLLNDLHAMPGCKTVLLSGRSMRDLVGFFPDFPGTIVGSHGAEQRIDGKLWQHPAKDSLELARIIQMVHGWADNEPDVLVEEKPCSVVQHFNRAPDKMAEALNFMECIAAHFDGFMLHRVKLKMAAEILPENVSKRRAVEVLMQQWPSRMPIAFGDDLGDEEVFEAVNRSGGQSIRVGNGETYAMFRLADPGAVRDTLRGWLESAV